MVSSPLCSTSIISLILTPHFEPQPQSINTSTCYMMLCHDWFWSKCVRSKSPLLKVTWEGWYWWRLKMHLDNSRYGSHLMLSVPVCFFIYPTLVQCIVCLLNRSRQSFTSKEIFRYACVFDLFSMILSF